MAGKHPVLIKSVYDDNFLKVEVKCFKEGMSCSKLQISAYGLAAAMILLHGIGLLSIQ